MSFTLEQELEAFRAGRAADLAAEREEAAREREAELVAIALGIEDRVREAKADAIRTRKNRIAAIEANRHRADAIRECKARIEKARHMLTAARVAGEDQRVLTAQLLVRGRETELADLRA